jgi:hypothetical protein
MLKSPLARSIKAAKTPATPSTPKPRVKAAAKVKSVRKASKKA